MRWAFRYIRWGDSIADSGHLAVVTGLKLVQGWNQTFKGLISLLYQLHANAICICKRQTASQLSEREQQVERYYQQAIASCMFITVFTRGDCTFIVNQCARFMSNPGPTHVAAIRPFLCFQAPGLWESLTYRRCAETESSVGHCRMLTMLAQMIVTVSAHGQS